MFTEGGNGYFRDAGIGQMYLLENGFHPKNCSGFGNKSRPGRGKALNKLFGTRERYVNLSGFSLSPLYFSSLTNLLRVMIKINLDTTPDAVSFQLGWCPVDSTRPLAHSWHSECSEWSLWPRTSLRSS
jgi:hypothetical protein